MPTIMLRGLPADLVARLRQHGRALGVHPQDGDRACVLTLIEYAIAQREARSSGGTARAAARSSDERSAQARHAAEARWGRHEGT